MKRKVIVPTKEDKSPKSGSYLNTKFCWPKYFAAVVGSKKQNTVGPKKEEKSLWFAQQFFCVNIVQGEIFCDNNIYIFFFSAYKGKIKINPKQYLYHYHRKGNLFPLTFQF